MELSIATQALSALAHEGRLSVFRLLVRAGPDGLRAGEIADSLDVRANTLSSNLAILARAGLVSGHRDGRAIIYRADFDAMRRLLAFLIADCCSGSPEICVPLSALLGPCGGEEPAAHVR